MSEEYKMVLVYRRDLKMRKGKMAAQVGHAVQALVFKMQTNAFRTQGREFVWWCANSGSKKVVLSCDDEAALLAIKSHAEALDIPHHLVTDTGHTEFHGVPTRTVIGLGPFSSEVIDRITGPEGVVPCKLA